jgi:isopenicillin N synthase-like dioxygenase
MIDVGGIHESVERRRELAREIKWAAENTGFFYIKNHGIEEAVIRGAQAAAKR